MWQVEHDCPQCGAPVTVEETSRLFTCPFCKVKLYMVSGSDLSYYLGPRTSDPDIFYVPYLRSRGMEFAVGINGASGAVIDGNWIAGPMPPCPGSLGVRPQAMKLHLAGGGQAGRFIRPPSTVSDDSTLAALRQSLPGFPAESGKGSVLWRFLKEAGGIIYSPFKVAGREVVDAITLQRVGTTPESDGGNPFHTPILTRPSKEVTFLPTLCPNCGADLAAEPESVALPCTSCGLLWNPSGEVMREMAFTLMTAHDEKDALFLPFWCMSPRVEGLESTLHIDPLKHVPPLYGAPEPISFSRFSLWAPAFFVNPVLFLRLCERATMWQPVDFEGKGESRTPGLDLYPVTLPVCEAEKLLSLILSLVVADRGKAVPFILHSDIEVNEVSLVYLPFQRTGSEATHGEMRATIELNALKYGRNL